MNKPLCFDPKNIPDLRWVAKLSNGETVWQNDEATHINSSWKNLKNYVYNNGLFINSLSFEFRSHIIDFKKDAFGYYFNKGCIAGLGGSIQCFIIGIANDHVDKIMTIWYSTPELEIVSSGEKTLLEASPYLIINGIRKPDGKI